MNFLADFVPYINTILVVCLTVGGFFAFRNGRQAQLTRFQDATNKALKQRIEALEGKITDFEKENVIQRHIIDTITSALAQRGLIITINGDMVTISDKSGLSTTHRKQRSTPTPAPVIKKDDDDDDD